MRYMAWTVTVGLAAAPAALAGVTVTQGNSAPTYSTTLNFDEPGGPTGFVATDAFASTGMSIFDSGDGALREVRDRTGDPGFGWAGSGNSAWLPFGAFLTFDTDLTEFSSRVWDSSGPPSPFGGGMIVAVFNDGGLVFETVVNPAFGGVGQEWIDITTDGGTVFDEVRFVGLGFPNDTYIDDLSWNAVPAPTAASLLGVAGIAAARRRRR
ncbi:MAG: hypothetical protein AAFX05_08280 [Planctomycetota bacterium]